MAYLYLPLHTGHFKVIDQDLLDFRIKPGDDFYQFVNGKSISNTIIPDSMGKWGNINKLLESNNKKIKKIFDEIVTNHSIESVHKKIIYDLYKTGYDEKKINSSGLLPIKPELNLVNSINNADQLLNTIIHFQKNGIDTLFDIFADKNRKGRNVIIPWIYQPELTLPEKNYYIKNSLRFIKIRKAYKLYISGLFQLSGESRLNSEFMAGIIINMERELAEISMSIHDRLNPGSTCNIMTINELQKLSPGFNWKKYFSSMGIPVKFQINVSQPDYFRRFGILIKKTSIENWKYLLKWRLLNFTAPFMGSKFVKLNFKFFGKFLKGEKSQNPHKEKIINKVNSILGEAVGQEYIKKYFNASSKFRIEEIFSNLKLAFHKRILTLEWMENNTRLKAIEKLNALKIKTSHPETWIDYSGLIIKNDYFIRNIFRVNQFKLKREFTAIGSPVNRKRWNISPQTVNAYYSPYLNEVVIPAALLEPPFFFIDQDDAVNYGTIGVVIAHEMTHAFDNYGKMFDMSGNLKNWWSENDNIQFKILSDKLIDQYNNYFITKSIHVNGKFTLTENIADIGGLTISYYAFRSILADELSGTKIDGFTPEQKFFIAYAQLWEEKVREKVAIIKHDTEEHPPGKFRTLGPLSNFSPFYKAFKVIQGNKMYRKNQDRILVW